MNQLRLARRETMKTINTIRKNTSIMIGFTLLLLTAGPAAAGGTALPGYEWMPSSNRTILLQPGWITSCQKDFIVENPSEAPATVRIDLGIEPYRIDHIDTNGKHLFELRENLSFAKQLGKTVHIDDVALVRNASDRSVVRVHC
jgi:hypothetical protein